MKLKVLHSFASYTPLPQNWAYRLLESIPQGDIYIHAKRYLKENFYNYRWTYFDDQYPQFLDIRSRVFQGLGKYSIANLALKYATPWVKSLSEKDLVRFVIKNEIQLVHSHFAPHGWKMNWLSKRTGVPHVISFYGFDYEKLPNTTPEYKERYMELFSSSEAIICEGQHGANTINQMGCPADRIHVVPLGLKKINLPEPRTKKEKSLNLVQVANITEKKGHIYAVEAFGKALRECPNMRLTLVGGLKDKHEGWIMDRIHELIEKYAMAAKVNFIERVNFHQLHIFLQSFDIFIHPSCYAENMDCEGGAPVVLLDAQAVGLPVIATNHCDIPNIIDEHRTGLLANEKDVEGLENAIRDFYLMSSDEYLLFSQRSIEHVKDNFKMEDSGKKLKTIYEKVI